MIARAKELGIEVSANTVQASEQICPSGELCGLLADRLVSESHKVCCDTTGPAKPLVSQAASVKVTPPSPLVPSEISSSATDAPSSVKSPAPVVQKDKSALSMLLVVGGGLAVLLAVGAAVLIQSS